MLWTVVFVLINEEHLFLVFIIINIFLCFFFAYIVFARLELVDKKGGGNIHLLLY